MTYEEMEGGIAEAIGKSDAFAALLLALIIALVHQRTLTKNEMVSLIGDAAKLLEPLTKGASDATLESAETALRGLATSLTKAVTRH